MPAYANVVLGFALYLTAKIIKKEIDDQEENDFKKSISIYERLQIRGMKSILNYMIAVIVGFSLMAIAHGLRIRTP